MARDYPRFGLKTWMRRLWSAAPANAILNATLFTPPIRALAQWIYFQKRASVASDMSNVARLRPRRSAA
jgi:hypothetical protein